MKAVFDGVFSRVSIYVNRPPFMLQKTIHITCFIVLLVVFSLPKTKDRQFGLPPTNTVPLSHEEDEDNQANKADWFEAMHAADPYSDWRRIEYSNQFKSASNHKVHSRELCSAIPLQQGKLFGHWVERGSQNQAGSVIDTEYHPERDEIWLISDGGTLFKGPRSGNAWEVVNERMRFSPGILRFVDWHEEERLLAMIGRFPHFSDDWGLNWQKSSGITYTKSNGSYRTPTIFQHNGQSFFYILTQPELGTKVLLHKSEDGGSTFEKIVTFETEHLQNVVLQYITADSKLLAMVKKETSANELYSIDPVSDQITLIPQDSTFSFEEAPANLIGFKKDTTYHLLAFQTPEKKDDNPKYPRLYSSNDRGKTWQFRGGLFSRPWPVGIYQSPSNPDILFYGEVDCFKSNNGGRNWGNGPINFWELYYRDPSKFLHADIMHIKEFRTKEGAPFQLISHHGGLNISYDYFQTQQNIGLSNLNVSQYYDVHTCPLNNNFIFASSQDQGLQLNQNATIEQSLAFDQILYGDYGTILFSKDGQSLWTVYPGGTVYYFNRAKTGIPSLSFTINSAHESVWLPPMMTNLRPDEQGIVIAGGNLYGGAGSYLIKAWIEEEELQTSQMDFNFYEASNQGQISALAISPVNPNIWYVATSNGFFFYSKDGGETWTQSGDLGRYLYSQTILPSKWDENTVYIGGSGYSNAPIFKSIDQGFSFEPFAEGLPSTLIYDMESSSDDELIFVASEAGPFAWSERQQQWIDISQHCAPNQAFRSVEWLETTKTARFGTFGRGIWDFNVSRNTSIDRPNTIIKNILSIHPNPASSSLFINLAKSEEKIESPSASVEIWTINGQCLYREKDIRIDFNHRIDISSFPKGLFLLKIHTNTKTFTQSFVKK